MIPVILLQGRSATMVCNALWLVEGRNAMSQSDPTLTHRPLRGADAALVQTRGKCGEARKTRRGADRHLASGFRYHSTSLYLEALGWSPRPGQVSSLRRKWRVQMRGRRGEMKAWRWWECWCLRFNLGVGVGVRLAGASEVRLGGWGGSGRGFTPSAPGEAVMRGKKGSLRAAPMVRVVLHLACID